MGRVLALTLALALAAGCGAPSPSAAPVTPSTSGSDVSQSVAAPARTLLDEHFQRGWPNDPHGTAWFGASAYTLFAREPGQFVAVRAPIADPPSDVSVSGSFRKIGGPPGGGYGLIVRDQAVGQGDGIDQTGQFVVAEVGDRGEVGIWQRADSHWVELLPWTASPLVRKGSAANELKVELAGDQLHFEVNGATAKDVEIGFSSGSVGVFVGGDANQVQLDRLVVEAAPTIVGRTAAAANQPAAPTNRITAAGSRPAAPQTDIPAARDRLTALAARANQDSSVMQDAAWRQEMAAALATVEQIAGAGSATDGSKGASPDMQRLKVLLGGIANDMASILGAFATGVDSQDNPINSPRALDQAAAHLNSAVGQANQALVDVEAARRAAQASSPGR